jgi:glucoamylase
MATDLLHSSFLSSLNPFSTLNLTSTLAQPIMYSFTSLLMAGSLAMQTIFAFQDPSRVKQREAAILKRSVDSFIAAESPIALGAMLCNIGSTGSCVSGASSGIVVASPDKTNPDCNSPHLESESLLTRFQTFIHGLATRP